MRDNWFSNPVFTSHGNIIDHYYDAGHKLINHSSLLDAANGQMNSDQCRLAYAADQYRALNPDSLRSKHTCLAHQS